MKVSVGDVYKNDSENFIVVIIAKGVQTKSRKNIEIAQKLVDGDIVIMPIDLSTCGYTPVGYYNFCTQEIEPLK